MQSDIIMVMRNTEIGSEGCLKQTLSAILFHSRDAVLRFYGPYGP
jgi:hypothetical protein